MRIFILLGSLTALIISGIWTYNSGFALEPLITTIMGVVGILYFFMDLKKEDNSELIKKPEPSKINNKQNINVNVNVGTKEITKDITPTAVLENNKIEVNRDMQIDSMKSKIKILFIDDDKKFKVVKILKESGWKNTNAVTDIKGVDIPIVKESDIFFVDINGVGKILDCEYEGLDIALMLKQKYPAKKVVIYSANKNNNAFHKAWDECDFKLEKNALPYQFQNLVEQYSIDILSKS